MKKKLLRVSLLLIFSLLIIHGIKVSIVTYATGLENRIDEEEMMDHDDDKIDQEDDSTNNEEDSTNNDESCTSDEDKTSDLQETEIQCDIQCNEMLAHEIKNLKIFNKRGKVLKIGDKGELIKSLNTLLKWLNYDVDETSLLFNPQTEHAVIKFQEDHSMKGTGIVDKLTYIRLNDYLHHSKMEYDYMDYGVKMGPTEDYWIIINKTTNVLQLYKGKNRLNIYRIATGRSMSFTPEGKFKISNKLINAAWKDIPGGVATNPLGSRWMGLSVGNHWTYGIHGCGRPESIGTYASAGCIRMYNFQAEELYDLVSVHTPVWIGTTDKIEEWVMALNKSYDEMQKEQEESKIQQYEEVMSLLLNPYINEALAQYYGEPSEHRTVEIISIEKDEEGKYRLTIILEVTLDNETDILQEKDCLKINMDLSETKIEVSPYEKIVN